MFFFEIWAPPRWIKSSFRAYSVHKNLTQKISKPGTLKMTNSLKLLTIFTPLWVAGFLKKSQRYIPLIYTTMKKSGTDFALFRIPFFLLKIRPEIDWPNKYTVHENLWKKKIDFHQIFRFFKIKILKTIFSKKYWSYAKHFCGQKDLDICKQFENRC